MMAYTIPAMCALPNHAFEPSGTPQFSRAAGAAFHYAPAARWTAQRAAAQRGR